MWILAVLDLESERVSGWAWEVAVAQELEPGLDLVPDPGQVLGQAHIHHQGPVQVHRVVLTQARKRAHMPGPMLGLDPGRVLVRRQVPGPGQVLGRGPGQGQAEEKDVGRAKGVAVVRDKVAKVLGRVLEAEVAMEMVAAMARAVAMELVAAMARAMEMVAAMARAVAMVRDMAEVAVTKILKKANKLFSGEKR